MHLEFCILSFESSISDPEFFFFLNFEFLLLSFSS